VFVLLGACERPSTVALDATRCIPEPSAPLLGRWQGGTARPTLTSGDDLELRADGPYTSTTDGDGNWKEIGPSSIELAEVNDRIRAYELSYVVDDEHLVLGTLVRTGDGTELGGSEWRMSMQQWNYAGSSANEKHEWTVILHADHSAEWRWTLSVAGFPTTMSDTGSWSENESGFSVTLNQLTQYSDTYRLVGDVAWPGRATYTRVCD
jgi:hypothetical protein